MSVSTVKRAVKGIKKGAIKQELIDQATNDLLNNLTADSVKIHLAALIADDITLSHRISTNITTTLEQIESQAPTDAREAAQIMQSLNIRINSIKIDW
ncbi:MAG: hypothetical protein AB2696_01660 [Candidatus Thiodiazotropha sp.]|nr:hypothetical protein [Candidatus Thiodiazotropha sp. (ex Lucina pensylvanica)]